MNLLRSEAECKYLILIPGGERNLTDGSHRVDVLAKFLKLFTNFSQFCWICCKIVAVSSSGFATEIRFFCYFVLTNKANCL